MRTIAAAWTLAEKDLRSFMRDRTALMLSILVPIALVSVFGWIMAYAFGGSSGMPKVSLHVADLQQSVASKRFVNSLSALEMLRVREVNLSETENADSAEAVDERLSKLIRDGDANHILIIPTGYDASLAAQETPSLRMLRDPGRAMEDQIVQLSVMQASMRELGGAVWVDAMDRILQKQGMDNDGVTQIHGWMTSIGEAISNIATEESPERDGTPTPRVASQESSVASKPSGASASQPTEEASISRFDPQALFEFMQEVLPIATTDVSPPDRAKQVTYQQAQSVAGMSVMMLLFALTSCGSVLLTEREDGTLKRLFAQPISRNAVLLGKFLFVLIVGVGQMAILFTYGEWMFRVGLFRDPVTLVVLSLVWVAAGGAFGMFLATVSRSNKQAESLASLLILMMAALGGCWFPLQMMSLPPLMDTVCKSTMTFWAMTGFQGMLWNQLEWNSDKTLVAIGWQLGWVVVFTLLSVYFFRRNYCRG
jgi:ABC-2 type transport system permease protein